VIFRIFNPTPFFYSKLIMDILAEKIPARQGRCNPRVVKNLGRSSCQRNQFIGELELNGSSTFPFPIPHRFE